MALLLSLSAIVVLVSVVTGLFAGTLGRPLISSSRHSALVAAGLLLPLIAGALVAAGLLLPELFNGCHCETHGLHHPHLCLRHPANAEELFWPAAALFGLWSFWAVPKLGRVIGDVWSTQQWLSNVRRSPTRRVDGVVVRLIDAPNLGACAVGWLRPWIVVDQGLWNALDREERRALVHHEQAHCLRADPLTLLFLKLCAAVSFFSGAGRMLEAWLARAEAECDRHAANVMGCPDSVAVALLAVERYRQSTAPLAALTVGIYGAGLVQRVRALLEPERAPVRANVVSDLVAIVGAGFGLSLVVVLLIGEPIHHAAETLLGWVTTVL
jgi:Zn-dependent protease with chaperone function